MGGITSANQKKTEGTESGINKINKKKKKKRKKKKLKKEATFHRAKELLVFRHQSHGRLSQTGKQSQSISHREGGNTWMNEYFT